jgi:hypothetical protein
VNELASRIALSGLPKTTHASHRAKDFLVRDFRLFLGIELKAWKDRNEYDIALRANGLRNRRSARSASLAEKAKAKWRAEKRLRLGKQSAANALSQWAIRATAANTRKAR